ncbi:MAG TPA: anti-sigma factor antagonist [Rhodospirillaceae bacterium]|nr:anti-sigma factor antagonist [Rhodospirillaceae bacterium]|tara:strand:- start:26 stop:346 length:321 start_codon:yes stop_codon:yes gene_type:complete
MKHEVKNVGESVVIAFEGDVDLQTSPKAREALLATVGHGRPVVVDLAKVGYIDSSGVASLVEALQTAKKGGQTLALAAVSEGALRVLKLARLDAVFTIHASVDDAV